MIGLLYQIRAILSVFIYGTIWDIKDTNSQKYDLHDSLYAYKCTIEMCVVTIFDTEQLSNDRMAC